MNCHDTKQLLDAYIDKELDAANTIEFEKHLEQCASCQASYRELKAVQTDLRKHLSYHTASAKLRRSVLQTMNNNSANGHDRPSNHYFMKYLYAGLAFAFSFALSIAVFLAYQHQQRESQLLRDVVSTHIRALTTAHLTDIKSTDSNRLRPWFASKLDFAPRVYQFAQQGFQLDGGRIDYMQQRNVASLVYNKAGHVIHLYTWPSPQVEDAVQEVHQKQGYQIVYWCQKHMNYWLISDIDNNELNTLAQLIRQRIQK